MLDQCCNGHPCCGDDLGSLLLQLNMICVLLFLIAATVVVKNPDWFGGMPVAAQSLAVR